MEPVRPTSRITADVFRAEPGPHFLPFGIPVAGALRRFLLAGPNAKGT